MALVGRDAELAELVAWLAARTSGVLATPPALLVAGEAGVGKTSLIEAALSGAGLDALSADDTGRRVRWASAVPWHPAPYGLLSSLVPGAHDANVAAASLLADGEPEVVVLDDLHWADEASLLLLGSFIDALAEHPVAVIGAYRAEELPRAHPLRRVRAHLRHRRQLSELALSQLPLADLPCLIEAVVGARPSPQLVEVVAEKTEGLPFLVREWLAALSSAGWLVSDGDHVDLAAVGERPPLPDSVRDAVLLRVAGLSDAERAAVDAAAVIGLSFTTDAVASVCAAGWSDDLDTSGLVRVGERGARHFRHALIQEALYADVPWSRRRDLHLAVAEAPGLAPATVARHLLAAGRVDLARPALLAAADEHCAAEAYRDAAKLLSAALESWAAGDDEDGRLAAVDRLARCAELSGDHTAAVRNLRELVERRPRPELYRRLAVQFEMLGHWPLVLSAREAAAAAFASSGNPGEAATERVAIAAHLRSAASFQAALEVLDLAEADAHRAEREDLLCRIGGLRGNVLARQGYADRGVALVRTSLDRALRHGLATPAAEIYQRLADSIEHTGDYRGAAQIYETAYEFCRTHEQDLAGQLCQACATVVMFQRGQWDAALARCADVRALPSVGAHAAAVAYGVGGLIEALRGHRSARAHLLEARTRAIRIDLIGMELIATWGLALLDEAAGQADRAAECYRHVIARCRATEERHYCVPILQYAAAFFATDHSASGPGAGDAGGDLAAIVALLAEAAEASGQAEARAGLAYAVGEAVYLAEGPGAAPEPFRRAIDLLEGLDIPVVDVLVRHRFGMVLSAAGDVAAGREAMLAAQRTAQHLRARILVDRATAVAAASSGDAVPPGLTPRESEILRLVGEGLTSREVARRLFLSTRTVEMHVRNAMSKLGSRTRAEAVRRLATAGSAD